MLLKLVQGLSKPVLLHNRLAANHARLAAELKLARSVWHKLHALRILNVHHFFNARLELPDDRIRCRRLVVVVAHGDQRLERYSKPMPAKR